MAEHRVVASVVEGSNPFTHPTFSRTIVLQNGPLAQLVEQLTLNQRVWSSSLQRPTTEAQGNQPFSEASADITEFYCEALIRSCRRLCRGIGGLSLRPTRKLRRELAAANPRVVRSSARAKELSNDARRALRSFVAGDSSQPCLVYCAYIDEALNR